MATATKSRKQSRQASVATKAARKPVAAKKPAKAAREAVVAAHATRSEEGRIIQACATKQLLTIAQLAEKLGYSESRIQAHVDYEVSKGRSKMNGKKQVVVLSQPIRRAG